MKKQTTVQIPVETFYKLTRYFFLEETTGELYRSIQTDIEAKIDAIQRHTLYSKSKDKTITEEEREAARKQYLDMVLMDPNFRF